jgi:RNA polymerase sigma-70 factor, ECF subfamily
VEQDDARLIDLVLQGDSAAFGLLVRRYQDRLFTALVHIASSRDEAEDVAQDAFIQAYLKLSTFARNSSFYTWLYRIAFNTAISRRRRKRVENSIEQAKDAVGDEPADRGDMPHDRLMREERGELIRRALGEISEEHRAILVLREIEGCDYEEISRILELPVGTVRSRLHRARLQLKEQLTGVLDEPME